MKSKYPHHAALAVAKDIVAKLTPFCEQIKICGSLRRMKSEVGDIEILYQPRLETQQTDFFATEPIDLAGEELGRCLAAGVLVKRPSEVGIFTWGALNKFGIHVESGIPCDFFCEPCAEDWARSMVVRTGPKDFNIRLMCGASKRGLHAHAYGPSVTDQRGERVPCASEHEFFELCSEPWVEPQDRK